MSSVTIVEKYQQTKSNKVSVKPFFDSGVSNMGLERYGMSLMDGVYHEEQLACLEINGIRRYLTGLNEFAPEVKMLPDDERAGVIQEIRTTVAQLERELASNVVSTDDPEFWNKIKLLRPDNHDFWSKITIRCGNEPLFLDPVKDPYDLIKLRAIEAGGFSIVAKNLEDARSRPVAPKFFLDKVENTASTTTELKKLRNKALAELQKLFDKTPQKLFLVAKVVDINSAQYKKSTPNDVIYDNMDKYINGESVERNKKKTAEQFLEAARLDAETLKIKALVKDATYYRFLATKPDGFIYHMATGTALGKTPVGVVEFLKNPLHQEVLVELMDKVEKMWNE